ncbi:MULTISPECIES: DUF4870 domain-containing protein [unclassified Sphingobacterium]|uniref:DUF4870 domain-containing protein n=1 Tax=unclassified Sphingobacterium TaxID=2609468 RepID=UPI0020C1BB07|nr:MULTISPECIES: DUF4870 domain-containing protein [unclassified Sphingobacterium]
MNRNDLKMNEERIQDNKTLAVVSYLTWIGLLVAFLMNRDKNDPFVKFHIRQNLGLFILGLVAGVLHYIPGVGGIVAYLVFIALFIFWVIGLIGAINGKENAVPVVGPMFQEWFKGF